MKSLKIKEWIRRRSRRKSTAPSRQQTSPLYPRLNYKTNEIRLLTLRPGLREDEIVGTLSTSSLDDNPQYYALSHRWATGPKTGSIRINDIVVPITPLLAEILLELRSIIFNSLADTTGDGIRINPARLKCANTPLLKSESLPIWIDSICIDQSSPDERSRQISIMDQIYGKAERVIVRLRGSKDLDNTFMPPLKHPEFLQCLKGHSCQGKPVTPLGERCKHAQMITLMQALFVLSIDAQEWWARAWIVQEVVLARNDPIVLVGGYAVMWSHFIQTMELLWQVPSQLPGYKLQRSAQSPEVIAMKRGLGIAASLESPVLSRQNIRIREMQEAAQFMYGIRNEATLDQKMSLGRVLNTIGPHRQATNPLDYIYAYLSFLNPEIRKTIKVDYNKEPLHLYWEVMTTMLQEDVDEALIVIQTYSINVHLSESGWPSWIPDFASQNATDRSNGRGFTYSTKWQNARPVEFLKDGRSIGLRGVIIDTISQLHLVPSSHDIDAFEMWKADQFVKAAIGKPAPKDHWLEPLDALKEFHVLWWLVGASLDIDWSGLAELWSALMSIGNPDTRSSLEEYYGSEAVESFEKVLQNRLASLQQILEERVHGRQIMVTNGGLVAVGTLGAERDDVLVYIFGMQSPYILRPTGAPMSFRLVGPARSYGLSHHEVLDALVREPAILEETTMIIV